MVIDTSAVLAIILGEREFSAFTALITHEKVVRLSAASYVEAAMVLKMRTGLLPKGVLDEFVSEYEVRIEPVTAEHAKIAADAFRRFGKGAYTRHG